MTPPMLSPDGHYSWDGQRWVANMSAPPAGPPPIPTRRARGGRRRLFVIAVLLVAAVISVAVVRAMVSARPTTHTTAAKVTAAPAQAPKPVTDSTCAPRPCASDGHGWAVSVSGFTYDAKSANPFEKPGTGNVFVTLNATFTNRLGGAQQASPLQFALVDGAGARHPLAFVQSCPVWGLTPVAAGGTLGPRCMAFEAKAGRPAGLKLVWTPTFSGSGYDIALS